ncbi:hypothetical protein [Streptomyces sp. URMC 125]|uniref:hypothetical protein n=1 Tax=Streptomyces sp. URMC 125 TaxID=3423419 RepID=UPI003F19A701
MMDVRVNGTQTLRGTTTSDSSGYQDTAYVASMLRLNAGDTVSTAVFVTSGRTATFTDGSWQTAASGLTLYWVGDF